MENLLLHLANQGKNLLCLPHSPNNFLIFHPNILQGAPVVKLKANKPLRIEIFAVKCRFTDKYEAVLFLLTEDFLYVWPSKF